MNINERIREKRRTEMDKLSKDELRYEIAEQKAIAAYLYTKTAHIERIVETINIQIEKLKELRKTLINDVVTGKIKVSQ